MNSPLQHPTNRRGQDFAVDESTPADLLAAGRSSFFLLVSRGINMLAQFCLVLIISRSLGQEGFGIFSFVLSATILAGYISNLGLDTLVTREVAKDPAQGPALASSMLSLKVCSSAAAFLIVNTSFLFTSLEPEIARQLWCYSLSLFFSSLSSFLWFYGDAFDGFKLHGTLWATTHVLRTCCAGMVLWLGGSLMQAFAALVISEAVALLLTWIAIDRTFGSYGKLRFRFEMAGWQSALGKTWAIAVNGILSAVSFRIDVLILQMLRGAGEVGLYSAAFKLVEMMHVLPNSFSLVYFPRFSRAFADGGPRKSISLLNRMACLSGAIGLFSGIVLYLAAPLMIRLLYGNDFLGSVAPLRILVLKIILMFINLPLSFALIAVGKERQITAWTAVATLINVTANFTLAPGYGRTGAAIASVLADVVLLIGYGLCLLWLRRSEYYYRNS